MPDDVYLNTLNRMEKDIAMVDRDAALASIAISLKRIADALSGSVHVGVDPEKPSGDYGVGTVVRFDEDGHGRVVDTRLR